MSNLIKSEEGAINLANAVVIQTANDYRKALCDLHRYKGVNEKNTQVIRAKAMKRDCEEFFTNPDRCGAFTSVDGKTIMFGIRKECVKFNYNLRAISEYKAKLKYKGMEE